MSRTVYILVLISHDLTQMYPKSDIVNRLIVTIIYLKKNGHFKYYTNKLAQTKARTC